MLVPSILGNNLFDDWFEFPFFANIERGGNRPYGRPAGRFMKTDIHEHDDSYEMGIELPGFKKEDLELELNNGYLSVKANKAEKNEETDDHGVLIRQERYAGTMQRSFYVGNDITEEDIKAKFENGILSLSIPKQTAKIPEKKTILIEG